MSDHLTYRKSKIVVDKAVQEEREKANKKWYLDHYRGPLSIFTWSIDPKLNSALKTPVLSEVNHWFCLHCNHAVKYCARSETMIKHLTNECRLYKLDVYLEPGTKSQLEEETDQFMETFQPFLKYGGKKERKVDVVVALTEQFKKNSDLEVAVDAIQTKMDMLTCAVALDLEEKNFSDKLCKMEENGINAQQYLEGVMDTFLDRLTLNGSTSGHKMNATKTGEKTSKDFLPEEKTSTVFFSEQKPTKSRKRCIIL